MTEHEKYLELRRVVRLVRERIEEVANFMIRIGAPTESLSYLVRQLNQVLEETE